jgi:hypothetical protein
MLPSHRRQGATAVVFNHTRQGGWNTQMHLGHLGKRLVAESQSILLSSLA